MEKGSSALLCYQRNKVDKLEKHLLKEVLQVVTLFQKLPQVSHGSCDVREEKK